MVDPVEKKDYYRDDAINLYDYMLVLWKRKYLIIAIFVVAVISASLFSLRPLPPVYRVTALLSPGQISQGVLVDSVVNILASLNEGAFNFKIIDALNLDRDKYANMSFQTGISKGSDVIYINYDTPDPGIGKKIVSELLKQIVIFYSNRTDANMEAVSKTIDILRNRIVLAENSKLQSINAMKKFLSDIVSKQTRADNDKKKFLSDIVSKQTRADNDKKTIISDITLLNNKIVLLKATEKTLSEQIKEVNENNKVIMHDRNELLKKGEKTESVALLLYSSTIQQNLSYISRLNANIDGNKIEQEAAKNEIAKKEIALRYLDTVKDIEAERDIYLQNYAISIKDIAAEKEIYLKNHDTLMKNSATEISSINREIEDIKFQKAKVEGIKILQEPYVKPIVIKQGNSKRVMIAGIASLFAGIFLAFFIEYISKMRSAAKQ